MIHVGDCLEVMRTLDANSVDAIVTDPPYGLGFMGKSWDHAVPGVPFWLEMLRVAKPGAFLVAFGGTRTFHRMACAIEDAGWELRDTLMWVYGSGFPKSLDVSKAIDKARDDRPDILRVTSFMADAADRAGISRADVDAAMGTSDMAGWWLTRLGHRCQCPKWDQWLQLKALLSLTDEMDAEVWRLNGRKGTPGEAWGKREVVGQQEVPEGHSFASEKYGRTSASRVVDVTVPTTDAARQWQGWGTALKPAWEPIILARKPLVGTVASNVLAYGTGALNIDGCRVEGVPPSVPPSVPQPDLKAARKAITGFDSATRNGEMSQATGRWPANLIHDGSEEVVAQFPSEAGAAAPVHRRNADKFRGTYGAFAGNVDEAGSTFQGDSGSAARFFYCAKADRADRNDGCAGFEERPLLWSSWEQSPGTFQAEGTKRAATNNHPTVKPTDLMRWLCRLVTPPGGLILDPFTGSGSTGRGAILEGFRFTGIELDPNYAAIAEARIAAAVEQRRVETAQLSLFDNATMKEFADAA